MCDQLRDQVVTQSYYTTYHDMEGITGFTYIQEYISTEEEHCIISALQEQEWDTTLSRRTLHYGWRYPYNAFSRLVEAAPIPEYLQSLRVRLETSLNNEFDQCIVNEYQPGKGIAPHIDHVGHFDDTIAVVSLGSDMVLQMKHHSKPVINIPIQARSSYVLQDIARYVYRHSIPRRKHDNLVPRRLRYSVTFRKTTRD